MTPGDICFSSIQKLSALLTSRTMSSREVVDCFLNRIEAHNGLARAFIEVTGDTARADADRADGKLALGGGDPLVGVPFCSKDLIDIAGVPTTAGSAAFRDNIPHEDAFLIRRMLDAGAVSLGKTNLHEFAYGATGENLAYGTAVNAYDSQRLAGGSSSGSAAAVAFGMAPAAFGTDTGGSVRAPAALSGLVGLKATFGRVSLRGVIPYCWSLDHVGVMTRCVADAALLLRTVAGHDPQDVSCADQPVPDYGSRRATHLKGLRVGVPRDFYFEKCDPEILRATSRVLSLMEEAGACLVEVSLPSMADARTVSLTVQMPEALSFHSRYLEDRGHLYGADFRAGLALGQCLLAEHYLRAKRFISQYRRDTNALFDSVDVIVTPATPVVAPPIGEVQVDWGDESEPVGNAITRYTTFFNMTGHPAIVIPSGIHSLGLPMGVQFVGRYFGEGPLVATAAFVENAGAVSLPRPQFSRSE